MPPWVDREEVGTAGTTPLVILLFGSAMEGVGGALRVALSQLPEAPGRPLWIQLVEDGHGVEDFWSRLQPGLARCLKGLPLDPSRRISMSWEVVAVGGADLRAERASELLGAWARCSSWPLRCTLVVEAADILCPIHHPAVSLEQLAAELRRLEDEPGAASVTWGGAYLVGGGNRFGFVSHQGFRDRYLARLLTLFAAGDLAGWLCSLPTESEGTPRPRGLRLSAIGLGSLWRPTLPWTEQAAQVQARRLADAHQSPRRLGHAHPLGRWLTHRLDHSLHQQTLRGRLTSALLCYLQPGQGRLLIRCLGLTTKVQERDPRCLAPLRPILQKESDRLLAELDGQLEAAGQDLVLGGGSGAFADLLAGLAGHLAALRQTAQRHQADLRELLRVDERLLNELLTAAASPPVDLGQPRPAFFALRWWQAWKRYRWLRRTTRALLRVLQGEVAVEIDAALLHFCEQAELRVRRCREALGRFRAELHGAGVRSEQSAGRAFQPELATDVASVSFADFRRQVEDALGPVSDPFVPRLTEGLSPAEQAPPWHGWDLARIEEALLGLARRDVSTAALQGIGSEAPGPPRREQLTALSRLSQPLVPVTPWAFDASGHHVFQRWFVPEGQEAPVEAVRAGVPWLSVVTVYRELPLGAVRALGQRRG